MHDQLLATEETLAAEAAVQRFTDGVRENGLLGELADVAGESHMTISAYYS